MNSSDLGCEIILLLKPVLIDDGLLDPCGVHQWGWIQGRGHNVCSKGYMHIPLLRGS